MSKATIKLFVCARCCGYKGAARTGSIILDCRCQIPARRAS